MTYKIQVNGYKRISGTEIRIARNIIVDADTKENAIQKAKIDFIRGKGGCFRLDKTRPIQYTKKINA